MTSDEEDRKKARSTWPIVSTLLDREGGGDDLSTCTTIEERLSMMWPLAVTAWSFAGGVPDYPRSEAPVRISRRAST